MPNPERGRLAEEKVVPVVEETAVVYKERVVTDRVRLHKRVHETREALDIPVQSESLEVERVPLGHWVEAPPAIRTEGDTTVYPVVEEVLVVEKRLRLVEEVRVTRHRETRHVRKQVALRHEEVTVEHGPAEPPGRQAAAAPERTVSGAPERPASGAPERDTGT